MLAYGVHLSTAFLLSSLGHIVSIIPISDGYVPMADVCRDVLIFFMGQAAAIMTERAVIQLYHQCIFHFAPQPAAPVREVSRRSVAWNLVGYGWVLTWFTFSGWWFVRLYVKLGSMDWDIPVPIVEPLLKFLSGKLGGGHNLDL